MTETTGKKTTKHGRPKRVDAPAKAVELAQRRAKVADMRRNGITWHRIAESVGVDASTVRRDWVAWMAQLDPPADREERRADVREQLETAVERARLDEQTARSAGDLVLADRASLRALKALADLRRLDGLDEPARVDVTSQGGPVVGPLDRLAGILGE